MSMRVHGFEERTTDSGPNEGGLNVEGVKLARSRTRSAAAKAPEACPTHDMPKVVDRYQVRHALLRACEVPTALLNIGLNRHAIKEGLGHDPGIRGLPAGHS